jgi:hypothetical protein
MILRSMKIIPVILLFAIFNSPAGNDQSLKSDTVLDQKVKRDLTGS